ncbi:MAG: MFS transporter [Flavobacteriaceae bacterium]
MNGQGYGWRLSLFYGLLFTTLGIHLPYLPLWLAANGLSATEISLILAVPVIMRVVATPLLAGLADTGFGRRRALAAYAAATAALFAVMALQHGFAAILLLAAAYAAFLGPLMPITEAVAMRGVRLYRLDYGRMRLWGSATFIAANFAGGLAISAKGAGVVVWMLAAAAGAMAVAALLLPRDEEAAAPVRRPGLSHWHLPRAVVPVVLASALIQSSHAAYYGFGSLNFRAEGYGGVAIGAFWAIGVAAEIAFFYAVGRSRFASRPRPLLIAGGLAALVRWPLMALPLSAVPLGLVQTLHALTFAATHYAAIREIGARVPEARAAAVQAMSFTVNGVAMSLAMLAVGPLYGAYGAAAYLAAALPALCGLGLAAFAFSSAPEGG